MDGGESNVAKGLDDYPPSIEKLVTTEQGQDRVLTSRRRRGSQE